MSAPTRQEIVDAFEAAEKALGGWAKADQKEALRKASEALGTTYERVREVMLDEWGGRA